MLKWLAGSRVVPTLAGFFIHCAAAGMRPFRAACRQSGWPSARTMATEAPICGLKPLHHDRDHLCVDRAAKTVKRAGAFRPFPPAQTADCRPPFKPITACYGHALHCCLRYLIRADGTQQEARPSHQQETARRIRIISRPNIGRSSLKRFHHFIILSFIIEYTFTPSSPEGVGLERTTFTSHAGRVCWAIPGSVMPVTSGRSNVERWMIINGHQPGYIVPVDLSERGSPDSCSGTPARPIVGRISSSMRVT